MSWLEEFEEELKARHVRPAVRERLVAELADHIACEQEASPPAAATALGVPREIAGQCAEELATEDARRGALGAFLALAATGAVFLVQQGTLGRTGYPGFDHGYSTPLALIAILAFVVGSQVALVCGVLAAWRAVRRWGVPVLPAAEIALLRRRATIGLAAGLVTTAGLLLYVVNFIAVQPAWWVVLCGTLAAGATVALAAALRTLRQGRGSRASCDRPIPSASPSASAENRSAAADRRVRWRVHRLQRRAGGKGELARQHLEQRHAEAIDVGARVVAAVRGRTTPGPNN